MATSQSRSVCLVRTAAVRTAALRVPKSGAITQPVLFLFYFRGRLSILGVTRRTRLAKLRKDATSRERSGEWGLAAGFGCYRMSSSPSAPSRAPVLSRSSSSPAAVSASERASRIRRKRALLRRRKILGNSKARLGAICNAAPKVELHRANSANGATVLAKPTASRSSSMPLEAGGDVKQSPDDTPKPGSSDSAAPASKSAGPTKSTSGQAHRTVDRADSEADGPVSLSKPLSKRRKPGQDPCCGEDLPDAKISRPGIPKPSSSRAQTGTVAIAARNSWGWPSRVAWAALTMVTVLTAWYTFYGAAMPANSFLACFITAEVALSGVSWTSKAIGRKQVRPVSKTSKESESFALPFLDSKYVAYARYVEYWARYQQTLATLVDDFCVSVFLWVWSAAVPDILRAQWIRSAV